MAEVHEVIVRMTVSPNVPPELSILGGTSGGGAMPAEQQVDMLLMALRALCMRGIAPPEPLIKPAVRVPRV